MAPMRPSLLVRLRRRLRQSLAGFDEAAVRRIAREEADKSLARMSEMQRRVLR